MNDKGSLTNAVLVPGLQALITAVLVGGLALVVCSLLRWPWQLAAVLTLSVLLARWLSLSGWWSDLVARILAPDLVIEPERIPPGEPQTINIHLSRETEGGYLEGAFIEAPVTDDELRLLAGGVIEGRSLTTSQWAYQIGRARWELLRDKFIAAGLLRWRSGNRLNGCEVTGRGLAVFRRLADPSPTRRGDRGANGRE
jgi:hypothetical protein